MNTFYFLRHGETVRDAVVHASEWALIPDATSVIETLLSDGVFTDIHTIYTSSEHKAIKTAEPISLHLNIKSEEVAGLEEMHRGTQFLSDAEFLTQKKYLLEHRDEKSDGGESANEALQRFIDTLHKIDATHMDTNILIVSHGTVLALYFAHIKNDFSHIFEYWHNMEFCALGIIEDKNIIRDISHI